GVRVGVRAAERRVALRATGARERDLEHEPGRAVAREELLHGFDALAAGPGATDLRAERDQRRLQVAAGRLVAGRGAEVAPDGALRAHLHVGDRRCGLGEDPGGSLGQRGDARAGADPYRVAVHGHAV